MYGLFFRNVILKKTLFMVYLTRDWIQEFYDMKSMSHFLLTAVQTNAKSFDYKCS